jgi:RNA 2',3'-cyclic 3'-phosphodiesterase
VNVRYLFWVMVTLSSSRKSQAGQLFLAVLPDVETSQRIYRMAKFVKSANAFRGRLTPPERLHVTLFSLSGLSEQMVGKACDAINEVRAAPFEISFDRSVSFRGQPGSRPFVLAGGDGLAQLKLFRRSLTTAFAQRDGLKHLGRRDFTPHITLLFDDKVVDEQPFGPIRWTVRDLALIHSMKGHKHLARWPLHV